MASIERTAYPRFPKLLTPYDLQRLFSPSPEKTEWVRKFARQTDRQLALMVQLKCFAYLHHFIAIEKIPAEIVQHIAACMGMGSQDAITYPDAHRSLYRHHEAIRKLLRVKAYVGAEARAVAVQIANEAAAVVNTRTDIINIMISEMVRLDYELPAFGSLVKIAETQHEAAESSLFTSVEQLLTTEQRKWLDQLVSSELPKRRTRYNELKRSAKRISRKHLEALLEQLNWLESLPNNDAVLETVAPTRLKHLADMAAVMDAGEMKDLFPAKRYTLTLALIRQMSVRARDNIAEMFIRRMSVCQNAAKEDLIAVQKQQRKLSEDLIAQLELVLELLALNFDDAETGRRVRELLEPYGSLAQLQADCEAIRAWGGDNYYQLIWDSFKNWRSALFRMARALRFNATTQDTHLIDALAVVLEHENRKAEWIDVDVTLSFASERWRKLVVRSPELGHPINRRQLEVCVFVHLSKDLRSGDICIEGSDAFADDRKQLLPWDDCLQMLDLFCERVGLPNTADGLVEALKKSLEDTATSVDEGFPDNSSDVTINRNGEPTVKRTEARDIPASAVALQATLSARIEPRNLLDVLVNINHWTDFTRHFGPRSGDDTRLRDGPARYLLTTFAMGTGMGVNQAARHLANKVSAHQLSYANRHHMGLEQQDAAYRDMTELYLRLPLPKKWGDGTKVAADGTQYDFYEQNMLVGMHFRYNKKGAVAYRHVANNYIAVFHHFIPPGMLEALYVIDGLQKANLSVQADTVYSDTHGQSEIVFAFAFLLGIQLMPRIRNWKDLKFYRSSSDKRYQHIDRIFTAQVDWALIRDHWQDLMQIAISIQAGRIASPMLLRKLSNESRYNRVFAAARELGRVLRTEYLLRWINSKEMRQEVNAETNKIESYHAFTKWLEFGGDVITENDPVEQQKRLRYIDMVASTVILQNTADMMRVLEDLAAEGYPVNEADLDFLSPYGRSVNRFGSFELDINKPPEPWLKETLFKQAAKQARAASDQMNEQSRPPAPVAEPETRGKR